MNLSSGSGSYRILIIAVLALTLTPVGPTLADPLIGDSSVCVTVPDAEAGDVAVVNITNTNAAGGGYGALRSSDAVAVYDRAPADQFSSVNFAANTPANPNLAVVTVGTDLQVCYDGAVSSHNVILDVAAVLPAANVTATDPTRLIDTRTTGPAPCGRGVGLTDTEDGDGKALFAFDIETGLGNYLLDDFDSFEGPIGDISARIPRTGNHVAIGPDCYVYFVTSRSRRLAGGVAEQFDSGLYRVPLRSQSQLTQREVEFLGSTSGGGIQSVSRDRRFVYTINGVVDTEAGTYNGYDYANDRAVYEYRFSEFDLAVRSLSDPDGSNPTTFIEDTGTGDRVFEGVGPRIRPRSDGTVWLGNLDRLQQFDPEGRTLTTIPFEEITCFHTETGEDLDFVPGSFDLASEDRVLKIRLRDAPTQLIDVGAYSVSRFDTGNFCS